MAEQTVGFFVSVETNTPCKKAQLQPTSSGPCDASASVFFFFAPRAQTSAPLMVTQKKHRQPQKTTCYLFNGTNPTQKATHHACSPAPAYTVSPAPWSVDGGLLFVASLFPVRSGK